MDRFFRGLLSGMSGGLLMNFWNFLLKDILKIASRNYVDWASVVIYGCLPSNWYEFVFGLVTHILWTGFLGVILAYLLPKLNPNHGFRIKGALFGFVIGLFIYGIAILLRMPYFTKIPFPTSFSNAIGGIIWGITTAQMLHWLEAKLPHNPNTIMENINKR